MFELRRILPVHPPHAFLLDHWLWVVMLIGIAALSLWSMTYFDSGIWDVIGITISAASLGLLIFLIVKSVMLTHMGMAIYEGEFEVVDVEQTSNNVKDVAVKSGELDKTFKLNTINHTDLAKGQVVVLELDKEGYFKSKDDAKQSYKLSDSLRHSTLSIKDVRG